MATVPDPAASALSAVVAPEPGAGWPWVVVPPEPPQYAEPLVQPAPHPPPEPHIVSQLTLNATPAFSFGSQLGLLVPKLVHDTVMSPVPRGKRFMCRIVRKNSGVDKRMYPTYELSLEEPFQQTKVLLLMAVKRKRSKGSYYSITSNLDNAHDYDRKATDDQYGVLGKLRSNFLGTVFNIYSNGRNPFKGPKLPSESASTLSTASALKTPLESDASGSTTTLGSPHQTSPFAPGGNPHSSDKTKRNSHRINKQDLPVRQELGVVIYNPNVLGLKGPRKMTILMNMMTPEGSMIECRPTDVKDSLTSRYSSGDRSDLLVLKNKSPQWNEETSSFVLNFNNRVSLASVKNFQIVHDDDCDFDAKLACE
ncbi:Tubby- protein 3 [Actinomortierella ambigua]|nr:Tubby- protein 3 [Actinomortierella ambigua]